MASTKVLEPKLPQIDMSLLVRFFVSSLFECLLDSSYRNFYKQRLVDDLLRLA